MVFYAPGTEETDLKRVIMSLQQLGAAVTLLQSSVAANTAAIATNTGNIATNTAGIAANTASIAANAANIATINSAWSTWTPTYTWGTVGGTPATFTTNLARYKQVGKLVTFQLDVTMSAVGAGNGAGLVFSIPATATSTSLVIGSGKEKNITGKLLALEKNSTTTGYLVFADGTSPITAGAGSRFQFGGTLEAA